MAITTLDGALSGVMMPVAIAKPATGTLLAGAPGSFYPVVGGFPAAGALQSGLNGAVYSSSAAVPAGIVPRKDPPSLNAYLGQLKVSAAQLGLLLLCDRLWDNTIPATTTGAQSIVSPTWPARDFNGATSGLGVLLGIEVQAATSATAAAMTVSYTNSAGTPGQSGGFIDVPTAAAAGIGRFYRIGLAAGDQGVQSVQSVNFSTAWTSGTFGLVAYRVLAAFELPIINVANAIDALTSGFPRLYNGACPYLMCITNTTAAGLLSAFYQETQG